MLYYEIGFLSIHDAVMGSNAGWPASGIDAVSAVFDGINGIAQKF